jgi:DNA-binding NtrC family response regulator
MGLVLWIDQNTFATSLLEKVFKKKNLDFYTIESAEDFTYLVEDISPKLIVLDVKTALNHLEAFKKQYEASALIQSLPFVLIDGELSEIKHVIGSISRPFDPFLIPSKLEQLLSVN